MPENLFMRILGNFFVVLVRVYQTCVSPFLGSCCRFYPSCSEYAILAVRRYGPFRGGVLSLLRILRCHPFHAGGYDPVK
jgi:uncharacterized protein